jgi:mono/diheme cytochrome c family protein
MSEDRYMLINIIPARWSGRITALVMTFVLSAALAGCSLASEPLPAGPIEAGPLAGTALPETQPAQSADLPVEFPDAATGALIYQQNCATCHGDQGAGDGETAAMVAGQGGEVPALADPARARSRSPQEWYQIITDGNLPALMPPWNDALTDAQRWDVAYYLYSFSAGPDVLAEGETLYDENFADTFGPHGEALGLDDPATAAQLSPQAIVEEYLAGSGVDLTEDQQWAVAAYMQTFGYNPFLDVQVAEEAASKLEGEAGSEATPPAEENAGEPPAEASPEESTGAGFVAGQIVNGSPGGDVPADLTIQLSGITLDDTGQIVEFLTRTASPDQEGAYRFDDLDFNLDQSAYVVSVVYDGVEFTNGAMIEPGSSSLDLPITIYEHTSDPSVISVDALHFVVTEHPDALVVLQVYVFSNHSDKAFVSPEPVSGGRRGSVNFTLPLDAYNVSFQDGQLGGRYVVVGDMIYDTEQVLPGSGSHTIIATYFVPFNGGEDIQVPIFYPTDQVNVLVYEDAHVRSDVLSPAGVQVVDNQAYNKYLAQGLSAGDTLSFHVQGGGLSGNLVPILVAAGGALAVLVAVGAGFASYLRRGDRSEVAAPATTFTAEQESLIRQIADLDDSFEAGRVNRLEYEALRAELKARLAGLFEDET